MFPFFLLKLNPEKFLAMISNFATSSLCTDFPDSSKLGPKDLQYFWSNIFGEFQGTHFQPGGIPSSPRF